jgi:hypothetical protein
MFGQLVGTLRNASDHERSCTRRSAYGSGGFAAAMRAPQHRAQGSRSSRSDGMALAVNSSGT